MPVPQRRSVVGRTLLRDRAYEVLRDAIVDGTLAPGEQLREGELEEWIGVSRTPIREALMRLQRAGLVRTRPGHSTTVAPLDDDRIADTVPVVAALHALAARLAAPRATETALQAMRDANAEFAAALSARDVDAALRADDALHAVVVRLADNEVLTDALDEHSPLLRRAERSRFADSVGDPATHPTGTSYHLHHQLIDALARADGEAAAALALSTWDTLGSSPVTS